MILGVAGSNGLEYIQETDVKIVYGVDINETYLKACQSRFPELKDRLRLLCRNVSDIDISLPTADYVIANLFMEYVGIDIFTMQLLKISPLHVSCVIQKNREEAFVSQSPYMNSFKEISAIHRDISETKLTDSMENIGYRFAGKEKYCLPGNKSFIQLEYTYQKIEV